MPADLSTLSPAAAKLASTYPPGIHPDLARACALHGVTADQFNFHASDVRVGCPSCALAATLKAAGPWNAMANIYRTNPEHSDAKRFPWGLDVPLARLSYYVANRATL